MTLLAFGLVRLFFFQARIFVSSVAREGCRRDTHPLLETLSEGDPAGNGQSPSPSGFYGDLFAVLADHPEIVALEKTESEGALLWFRLS